MPADYDLVILGGALEGRLAAKLAVSYGARVALVEPLGLFARRQQVRYLFQGLQQLASGVERAAVVERFRPGQQTKGFDWAALVRWSAIAAETQMPALSETALSASGVDVVMSMPECLSEHSSSRSVVTVASRQLRTRSVLAAFGTVPEGDFRIITGLESILTAHTLPQQMTVVGGSAWAVAWAQAFCALGVKVAIVTDTLMPDEDGDVRWWVRSQLISDGINILTPKENTAPATPTVWIGQQKPALCLPEPTLNVFTCGAHKQPVADAVIRAEVQVAVWNALFFGKRAVDYGAIAHPTPDLGRVGITPDFAKAGRAPDKSERAYQVWTASSPNSDSLQCVSPSPSFCKLISHQGRLQSIHLLGKGSGELAQCLSVAVGKPVANLRDPSNIGPMPTTSTALIDLVRAAAAKSQQDKWQPGHWRRDWAENWFNWRRSRK